MPVTLSQRRPGQGLLEVVIAVGVIMTSTIGTITLVASTVKAGRSSSSNVTAASLAREGIEAVRSIRDSNWLKIQASEDTDPATSAVLDQYSFAGLFDQTLKRHTAVPAFDQSANSWTTNLLDLGGVSDPFTKICPSGACAQVYQNAAGMFQSTAAISGASKTGFTRLAQLNPICRRDDDPVGTQDGIPDVGAAAVERIESAEGSGCAATNEIMVGLQVVSTVKWNDGIDKTFELEDRLYNWKYAQ